MSLTPEQIVATSKANVEAGLKTATSFVTTLFTAVERVSSLNLATARGAFDDSIAFSKAVLAAKDPKALAALQLGAVSPAVEKSVAYGRSLSTIGGDTHEELTKLVEGEASVLSKNVEVALDNLSKNVEVALDNLFKNAPAGSEPAIKAVKTALANASSAYEGAQKAAKQVAAAAQASVEKATAVAVENVDKGAKAAASALKVA